MTVAVATAAMFVETMRRQFTWNNDHDWKQSQADVMDKTCSKT